MPSAKKFAEMGVSANKEVDRVEQIETTTRSLEPSTEVKEPEQSLPENAYSDKQTETDDVLS